MRSGFVGTILLILAGASFLAAMWNEYKAYTNLAEGMHQLRQAVWRLGPFAERAVFTDPGWVYWKRMWRLAGLTLLLMIVGAVLVARR